jgi:RNA polymerase sigma factor (sigma-70 family)
MSGTQSSGGSDQSRLDCMGDEELVDLFLASSKNDRSSAHQCFEAIIARYKWLIDHVVRSSRFRFPPWDSADDVISRAVFKVYRGLASWRRQGKLSSFIARIVTSEMIDTIRRVGRDKSWDCNTGIAGADSERSSPMDSVAAQAPTPEAQAEISEQRSMVARLLADVCQDWKDSVIINEYVIGGRGAKEVAQKYEMSEDLVYQRARRLRVRLLKWLADHGIHSSAQLLGPVTGIRA